MSEKLIKNENHVVIHGWMINELGLKGSELICYATIWGFTQGMENQYFTGSRQYLADWCNITKKGIDKVLMSLVEKKLLIRHEKIMNNIMFVEYQCTDISQLLSNSVVANKVPGGGEQSSLGVANKVPGGGEQSSPNNIEHNIDNNIEHNKEKEKKEISDETDMSKIKSRGTNFERIISNYTENEELRAALNDFIKMRKAIKKVLTDRALTMICKELDKLAQDDATKIAILNQSIMNSWQGVFPIKERCGYGNGNAVYQQYMVQPYNGTGVGKNGRSDYRVTEGLV